MSIFIFFHQKRSKARLCRASQLSKIKKKNSHIFSITEPATPKTKQSSAPWLDIFINKKRPLLRGPFFVRNNLKEVLVVHIYSM